MPYTADWSIDSPTRQEVDALPGLTLVEFGAAWCPHCQAVQGLLRQELETRPEIRHLKVEDGKGRPLGRSFSVRLWPNFVFLQDGQVAWQLARPLPADLVAALAAP
jgi:thioredoxin 1